MAVLWNGAALVDAFELPARVVANIAVWLILLFGLYYLAIYGDFTIGFEMSWLSLGRRSSAYSLTYATLADDELLSPCGSPGRH